MGWGGGAGQGYKGRSFLIRDHIKLALEPPPPPHLPEKKNLPLKGVPSSICTQAIPLVYYKKVYVVTCCWNDVFK